MFSGLCSGSIGLGVGLGIPLNGTPRATASGIRRTAGRDPMGRRWPLRAAAGKTISTIEATQGDEHARRQGEGSNE